MKKVFKYNSGSPEETIKIAGKFAKNLIGGETILLSGDLGAGKTHFTKGIAVGLGITDEITSPTFAIHNTYDGRLILNHFDFYRLNSAAEAENLGLDEFFYDIKGIAVIEWWRNIKEIIPARHILISISGQGKRLIEINCINR